MPKSNSDADENDSLTSDDEAVGPTVGRVEPQNVQSAPAALSENLNREEAGISEGNSLRPPERPIAKLRSSVNKIISMNRAQSALLDIAPGTEPGADPRKSATAELFGNIRANCKIEMWEYGPSKARFTDYDNKSFITWLSSNEATAKREIWKKVRWINISGISWDVISALAIHYNLHPLAIEDVLHGRPNARSKADYYTRHLFIHVLTHKLGRQEDDSEDSDGMVQTEEPLSMRTSRTSSTVVDRDGFYDADDGMDHDKKRRGGWLGRRKHSNGLNGKKGSRSYGDLERRAGTGNDARKKPRLRDSLLAARRAKVANEKAIDELKKGFGRVYVEVASAWMFLLRDGTLISISQDVNKPFGASVVDRLRVRDTVLRSSGDASLLLEGLLDLVVDDAVEVVDKYHNVILKMERSILLKPNMKTVRGLHIISGDLTLHKRTLGPLSQLIYGLRRYDLDRCKALAGSAGREGEVTGYLSHQAKVYLADVHDHVEYIMSSLDMFTSIAENLINYTFNIVSYETNQVMRGLTIATVIFFPLTFLTGYFGMNFDKMSSVQNNSELLFWIIAIPVMFVVTVAFLFPDIQKLFRFIKKRMATRKYDY
ncbi:hypothetical protein RSOLAG22IIIB_00675 [Rhizoctonia solani]|uniref:Magnesium transport protein CorA n=1 Tax=Rhizoctonia solani TaxID=456999 RepID=A0A0K6FVL2_9AGAM|nr:hypothetical protein RSOLAG22IIIB_00675 [Rhizoctonia solani]